MNIRKLFSTYTSAAIFGVLMSLPACSTKDVNGDTKQATRDEVAAFLQATNPEYAKQGDKPDSRESQDPLNIIYTVDIDDAKPGRLHVGEVNEKLISQA